MSLSHPRFNRPSWRRWGALLVRVVEVTEATRAWDGISPDCIRFDRFDFTPRV